MPSILLIDNPSEEQIQAIREPLSRFNLARTGIALDYKPLVLALTDPTTNDIVGGIWGYSYYGFLYIDLLYIPENLRHAGLGSRLIKQAEAEAKRRNCRGIWLDTFSWQALGFYLKLGFVQFGTIDDYPPGNQRYFLKKTFD